MPLTEDFTDTALRDEDQTFANWSTEEEALFLNRSQVKYGVFDPGVAGSSISSDAQWTWAVALGDMDGDGDLDLIEGNVNEANLLYLNNGTSDPFNSVNGLDIGSDTSRSSALALGDVDSDGDLDLVAGNNGLETNQLYLYNGTASPFNGVVGSAIGSNMGDTFSVVLFDLDRDGDLDLVSGNGNDKANYLYLNNGTANPFEGVSGSDFRSNAYFTRSIVTGDVDSDGDLDIVAGNDSQANRLYLNDHRSFFWGGAITQYKVWQRLCA